MDNFILEFAPVIIVVLYFVWRTRLFVTQAEMLELLDIFRKEMEKKYATKELVSSIREDIQEIKDQLKTISDFLITNR